MHTQLRKLRERLNSVALTDHWPEARIHSVSLFENLESHFFDRVDGEADLARFQASGIPNRHACLHGVIDYQTFQHSVNSLIFADYLLRMLISIKSETP